MKAYSTKHEKGHFLDQAESLQNVKQIEDSKVLLILSIKNAYITAQFALFQKAERGIKNLSFQILCPGKLSLLPRFQGNNGL